MDPIGEHHWASKRRKLLSGEWVCAECKLTCHIAWLHIYVLEEKPCVGLPESKSYGTSRQCQGHLQELGTSITVPEKLRAVVCVPQEESGLARIECFT